jgi:hypothetical protein
VVTLIGVLEYSRRFIDAADPVLECLRRARSWLAEGGMLILAIENQLGLKYFAGCAEDHLDLPYAGIEGLYGKRTAVTFGRRELAELLARAGFASQEWHFPFPDYKLPGVVVANPPCPSHSSTCLRCSFVRAARTTAATACGPSTNRSRVVLPGKTACWAIRPIPSWSSREQAVRKCGRHGNSPVLSTFPAIRSTARRRAST